jgi:hypothetical protein
MYFGAISSERLINCVIHDFIDEVVQAPLTCGADIHAWAFADSGEALKNCDRTGVIPAGFFAHVDSFKIV